MNATGEVEGRETTSSAVVASTAEEQASPRRDVDRRALTGQADRDSDRMHATSIVVRLALGKLERDDVVEARALLLAAAALLD